MGCGQIHRTLSIRNLDGSESRNQHDRQGDVIVTVSRANWKGEQFIITSSTTYPDGSQSESVDTWSLDAKGHLVIEGAERMTRADGTAGGTGKLHVVLRRNFDGTRNGTRRETLGLPLA